MRRKSTNGGIALLKVMQSETGQYLPIEELLNLMTHEHKLACQKILEQEWRMKSAKGSENNHQSWEGGYLDHIHEVMNIADYLYIKLDYLRPMPFLISDALIVLFLHDIEKPYKYTEEGFNIKTKRGRALFRLEMIKKYGIKLTLEQQNALKYVEGEGKDYTNLHRIMNELAAFCHVCDTISARVWHDYPKKEKDPWKG